MGVATNGAKNIDSAPLDTGGTHAVIIGDIQMSISSRDDGLAELQISSHSRMMGFESNSHHLSVDGSD